jgi:hypothetical protein
MNYDKNAQWLVPIEYTDGKGRLYEDKFNFLFRSSVLIGSKRLYGNDDRKTEKFNWLLDGKKNTWF